MGKYENIIELFKTKDFSKIDLGLDRIKSVLNVLGNPQDELEYIHIAGTNGKGSVASIIDSVLREAGYKTGLYLSPHIFDYTERIKFNGNDISKEDFAHYANKVLDILDKENIKLTEFEILTVVMFMYLKKQNAEVVILETGLGGRFDATNVISKNLCSIITHINLEHTDLLGDTTEKIASEKACIIKPNCPVITIEGYETIKDKANDLNSLFILSSPNVKKDYVDALKLKGTNQVENLALALTAIEYLYKDINEETLINGLKKVHYPCRFQYIKAKNLIIDAAHNPDGIVSLIKNLNLYYPDTKKRFIFGCLNTKDYKKMIDELFSFSVFGDDRPEIYFYTFNHKNACTYKQLSDSCIYYSKELKDVETIRYSEDILTVICGSIYMINELIDRQCLSN